MYGKYLICYKEHTDDACMVSISYVMWYKLMMHVLWVSYMLGGKADDAYKVSVSYVGGTAWWIMYGEYLIFEVVQPDDACMISI